MLVMIYLAFLVVLFYWQINNVKTGKCGKGRVIVLHAAYTIVPVVLYGAMFVVLVGVEEFTGTAIIGEGYARSLFFVIAGGVAVVLLSTLIFSIVVLSMKPRDINAT